MITVPQSKYKEMEFDEVVGELYKHPIGSREYKEIRSVIINKLKDDKYKESIITFPSKMNREYESYPNRKFLDLLNNVRGIREASVFNSQSTEDNELFSSVESFPENKSFLIKERKEVEYNPEYKQLVVSSYVTDGRNVILLHTGQNGQTRIQGKYTFIQGHVDFGPMAYIKCQEHFLMDNMYREFKEEIKMDYNFLADIDIKYYINDTENYIGLEHFGVIYEIRVKDCASLYKDMTTGEENKHKVIMLDLHEYNEYEDTLDSWVQLVFKKLRKELGLQ